MISRKEQVEILMEFLRVLKSGGNPLEAQPDIVAQIVGEYIGGDKIRKYLYGGLNDPQTFWAERQYPKEYFERCTRLKRYVDHVLFFEPDFEKERVNSEEQWSEPLSLPRIGLVLSGKGRLRGRKVLPMLSSNDRKQVSKKLWQVRLGALNTQQHKRLLET
jgi:hypothetical protein